MFKENKDNRDSAIPTLGKGIEESGKNLRELPNSFTLKELKGYHFPEPCPLVDGLLYRGNVSLVAAKPKVGKSTLMRYLAKSIVDGNDFLDRETTVGSVLYLALEEQLYNVKRDFIEMGVVEDSRLAISCLFNVQDKFSEVENLILKYSPVIVIVDTLVHATGILDINDYTQTTRELRKFRELASKYDVHICLVHHSKKGDSQGNESVLGSTGLTGAVDLIVTIDINSEQQRVISSTGRSGSPFERMVLLFDAQTKSFRGATTTNKEDLAERIFKMICENPGVGRDEIQTFLKKRSQAISKALTELEEAGKVETRKSSGKNLYFPLYVLSKVEVSNE